MDSSNIINKVLHTINYVIEQIRANSWNVFLFVLALYFLKHQYRRIRYYMSGWTLGSSNSSSATKLQRSSRDEELHQARIRQQEIYNQRAKEMLEERRRNELASVELNPDTVKDKNPSKKSDKKKAVSTSSKSATSGGYNPMQPWTSSAGGGGYRPSRRSTGRGG